MGAGPAAGSLGRHQLRRPEQPLAGGTADPAAVRAVSAANRLAAVGVLLDLCSAATLWRCGLAFGSVSSGLGDGWRLPAVVGRHRGHRAGQRLLSALPGAAAAGRGRVGCVSVLLARLCRTAAGASRPRQRADRRGHQAGTRNRRICRRNADRALRLARAVRRAGSRRIAVAASVDGGDTARGG